MRPVESAPSREMRGRWRITAQRKSLLRLRREQIRAGCTSRSRTRRSAEARSRSLSSLGAEYQGGPGFIHGGIVATVLDEVMSKVSRFSDVTAVTAELRVEYLRPIRVDQELFVEAFSTRQEGRQLYNEGEIRDAQGVLLARGKGRFAIALDREEYAKAKAAATARRASSRTDASKSFRRSELCPRM